jgi:hypothetical protein
MHSGSEVPLTASFCFKPNGGNAERLCENSGQVIYSRTAFYQTDPQETPISWVLQTHSIAEKYSTGSA